LLRRSVELLHNDVVHRSPKFVGLRRNNLPVERVKGILPPELICLGLLGPV
jgi:hypothetical protein